MIEVLVAVLIMGIGLLGMAAMQTTALRNSQSALERSQAAMHTYALLDTMRANRAQAIIGAYDLGVLTCSAPARNGTLAMDDLARWFTEVQGRFALGPSACAQITCVAESCQVMVQWADSGGRTNPGEPETFVTGTRL